MAAVGLDFWKIGLVTIQRTDYKLAIQHGGRELWGY